MLGNACDVCLRQHVPIKKVEEVECDLPTCYVNRKPHAAAYVDHMSERHARWKIVDVIFESICMLPLPAVMIYVSYTVHIARLK